MQSGDQFAELTLLKLLGKGSYGEVWLGQSADNTQFAIKALVPELVKQPKARARFARESSLLQRMDSPHVCRLHAFGEESGRPYLVFDYFPGETLAHRLKRLGHLSFAESLPLLADVLCGLEDAHALGIVHRDLKPSNIVLTPGPAREEAKILDFGASKLTSPDEDGGDSLTSQNMVVGSLAFMPPEQMADSRSATERADLYAFGATAFFALTGRRTYETTNAMQLVQLKLQVDPPTLSEVTGRTWPQPVEDLIARLLSRQPTQRPLAVEARAAWSELSALVAAAPELPPVDSAFPAEDSTSEAELTVPLAPRRRIKS